MVLNFRSTARLARSRDRGPTRARPRAGLTCLLTPLHPERALSFALVQHLTDELPDLEFTLEDRPGIDLLWVCGYEPGHADLIRAMRARHPFAQLLVTAKAPEDSWAREVVEAGANMAMAWPADFRRLTRALRRDRPQGRG